MSAITRLVDWAKRTRPWDAWQRYGHANGDLLAAGIGYYAFFSVFPAVALGFTIFGFVLRGHPDLLYAIADSLNEILPGMVQTPDQPDGIITLSTPEALTLTVTGIVSLITLIWAGLGWVGALRTGMRGIFGLEASPGNIVTTKARDLGVFASMGVAVLASALLSSLLGAVSDQVAAWVGLPGGGLLVSILGLALAVAIDTAIMVVLLRILSGVPLPWVNVRDGALLGALLLTVIKYFGGVLIAFATRNPLLSAVAVSVGLLFWLNLIARVVLLSASWAANKVDLARLAEEPGTADEHAQPDDGGGATSAVEGPAPAGVPAAGPIPYAAGRAGPVPPSRAQDRVSLVAGAVLGATAVTVARWLRRR